MRLSTGAFFAIGTKNIMKLNIPMLASLAAISAAAGIASVSFAQEPPSGAAPPPAGAHEHWAEHRHEHQQERAKALHDILNIRPDQEPAFQAFLASMAPPERADGMREHGEAADMAQLTTPQRLDRMAARMAEHQAKFQQRADAVRRFYAALGPEQQRAFDALHGMMGQGHHGHGGPGGADHSEGPRG
jgi:protein CpxP